MKKSQNKIIIEMQTRQRKASSDSQLLHFDAKMFIFVIICNGFIIGQVSSQFHGNSDDIVFPGPINSRSRSRSFDRPTESSADDNDSPIPLSLAARLNSVETMDEFLQLLQGVPEKEKVETFYSASRFNEGKERSNAIRPTPAKCIPELQPVSLKLDDDPTTIIFPSCTRIKRCGGCCGSSLLSCQPTAMEIRNFEVIVSSVSLNYKGRRIVPLEEHTKCICDCKMKEEHCNDKQHYESRDCKCVCNNIDEAEKCRRGNDTKIWNSELCACSCKNVEPCSTGYYFNHNTCRCERTE